MSYLVAKRAVCDDCSSPLTEDERSRNEQENREQDGNSLWCDSCASDHTLDALD